MYDPTLGRFLQRDPMTAGSGGTLYGYVADNPATGLDPTGKNLVAPDRETAIAWNAMLEDTYGIKTMGVYPLDSGRYYILVDPKDPKIAKIPDDANFWGQTVRSALQNEQAVLGQSPAKNWAVGLLNGSGDRAPLTREDIFKTTALRNGIDWDIIEHIMKSTDFEKHYVPFKEGFYHNACERWANEFYRRLHESETFVLYYEGKFKIQYVWFDKTDLWGSLRGTEHVAIRITFRDGNVFYFDSRWFTRSHIALPADVPASYKERRSVHDTPGLPYLQGK